MTLIKRNISVIGIRAAGIIRLNIYFLIAVGFDTLRNLGFGWATNGILASMWMIFSSLGVFAATVYFCPESRSLREASSKLRHHISFDIYQAILLAWLLANVAFPELYLPSTLVLLVTVIAYPTSLFSLARKRAQMPRLRDMLSVLSIAWFSFVVTATFLFALGADPPVLGVSLPFAWEIAFVSGSAFFVFMTKAVSSGAGFARPWIGSLLPESGIKLGQRYLVVHDAGDKALSFLTSSFKAFIEMGARIVMKTIGTESFLGTLASNDARFVRWIEKGKLVVTSPKSLPVAGSKEGFSDRLGGGAPSTVYVTELERGNVQEALAPQLALKDGLPVSELLLVESSKAPKGHITEFLSKNPDVQFLDFSDPKAPFSGLVDLDHLRIQGNTILLEHDGGSGYEDVVSKFLAEGMENAEVCALFTSKSSKLYRAMKGTKLVKTVAASSLVSSPEELPDGEIQIPDRELGLVTSILSDMLEDSGGISLCFVFDSITELVRGDHWEQMYSGIKQIVEMLNGPNATTLFLANRETMEPRFLAALRGVFPVLMRLDRAGLQVVKLPTS